MTHPNHQTNGASLEDCHTNFFALTDLCGIKWRKLVWGESSFSPEPLDDPVLSSYARCLAVDILCVWRRVATQPPPGSSALHSAGLFDALGLPPAPHAANAANAGGGNAGNALHPPLSLQAAKELWIFWYGEEPDLTSLVSPELVACEGEHGSWENGLSYECRSLLFKSLHNLIERCLLAREFMRVGRWFVQPYDGIDALQGKSVYFSFSFAFFVHGESTVCASIDVRTHPLVRNLSRHHLQHAQTAPGGVPVLLAPFGLSGVLTGPGGGVGAAKATAASEPRGLRLLEEWRQFFPLRAPAAPGAPGAADDAAALPPLVEVVVGGVKMRYPAGYVLVTDLDVLDLAGASPSLQDKAGPVPGPPAASSALKSGFHAAALWAECSPALRLPEHVWHDVVLNPTAAQDPVPPSAAAAADDSAPGAWDFTDPARKPACLCAKCKRSAAAAKHCGGGGNGKSGSALGSSSGLSGKQLKADKGGWVTPFHHRSPRPPAEPAPPTRVGGSATPSGGPPSYQRGQSLTPTPTPAGAGQNAGSPASAAPSPLPNPHSQPASVPPPDAMPTLSPHPPASAPQPATPLDAAATPVATPTATPTDAGGPKSVSSVGNQVFSPYPAALSVEGVGKAEAGSGSGVPSLPPAPADQPPATPHPAAPSLKRPVLTSREYETVLHDEEHHSALLYDYSTLDAWLNHPVKRFKPSTEPAAPADAMKPPLQRTSSSGELVNADEAAAGATAAAATAASASAAAAMMAVIKTEIKQEPGTVPMEIEVGAVRVHNPNRSSSDPYEFDDDTIGPAVSMEGFKRTNSVKEEDKKGDASAAGTTTEEEDAAAAKAPGNLFTNEGLQASYRDLEQIFDNSDEASSDLEAAQALTPPCSGKGAGGAGEEGGGAPATKPPRPSAGNSSLNSCGGSGILRPEELSKMFPTPPSLDNNPISSPCGGHTTDIMFAEMADSMRLKQEIYPNMGSPQDEPIEDWSFVYRPAEQCQYVGSSKYAPLTNLPSAGLPSMSLPPGCVYKPSWQYPPPPAPPPAPRPPLSPPLPPPPASPMAAFGARGGGGGVRTPCPPPPPYELPSPATSTASSYLNKNVNSVEPAAALLGRAPEASALVVNLLLGDTSINIFRDHNFDSCTLCVCNAGPKVVGNIRGADTGYFLPAPQPGAGLLFPPSSPFPGMGGGAPPPPYSLLEGGGVGGGGGAAVEDDPIRCTCGFSAVVNRRLSHRCGLFYEDEMEITGIAEDPSTRKKGSLLSYLAPSRAVSEGEAVDVIPASVLELVREQCAMVGVQTSSNSLCRASRRFPRDRPSPVGSTLNLLDFSDSNDIAAHALEQGRLALLEASTVSMCKVEEMAARQQHALSRGGGGGGGGGGPSSACVHRWPHLRARGPHCSQDIVRVMKTLQPLLQDAIQKKCQTRLWEAPYTVSGPLTWRQFHRLAGRGTDDRCEPQPVPSLVVGYDKDWLSLSPYALHYWEKLLLEPYSYARDVAYVVVAPDNDYVLQRVRTYFKELSSTYEVCRLGRHCPITKVLRDGILRVGKSSAVKLAKEPVDEWFLLLGENPTTNMLKLYAQVCRHHLAPYLSQIPMDRTLLDPSDGTSRSIDRPMPSPMPPPSTPETPAPVPEKPVVVAPKPAEHTEGQGRDPLLTGGPLSGGDAGHEEDTSEPPALVVYLVDPFTMGSDSTDLQRLACLGLLRCFAAVQAALPDNIRANISVQLISLESVVDLGNTRDRARHNDDMRAQAFSVYSQCRKLLTHTSNVKALTGFGTAAMSDLFLKNKDEKNRAAYRLYSPPFILGPIKERTESGELFGQQGIEQCSVLYASYCLSDDQRWLLAVITDEHGEIFETTTINIDIPNRVRRKKASARRIGLQKLMDFILGVMSQSVQPWRLVVGRLGRIGHGELKGWSWLLSRKSLLKASKQLKEICGQCSLLYPSDVPCVLSACLVSLEPDSALRLMPDQFTPDERFSAASVNCQLSTPHDVSCTHILVFPTSATTQSSQTAFQEQHINGPELGDDELFSELDADMPEGIEGMQDFSDIFTCWPEAGMGGPPSPSTSPRRGDCPSQPGSPCGMGGDGGQNSPFPCNGSSRATAALTTDTQEEVGTLHQQPLALGYFVSTAPTGRMPDWFWASCPHLENVCPSFLKNALHLHSPAIQQNSDDLLQQQSNVTVHPLDSQYTTDVLRYVLEGYNALSWLALDSNTKDRLSCLPVHVQALMQLYHMTAALV